MALLNEMQDVVCEGSYVNSRHILMLVDCMTGGCTVPICPLPMQSVTPIRHRSFSTPLGFALRWLRMSSLPIEPGVHEC